MKVLVFIWNYLKDWRNWVSHTIIGITILLVAFYLPVRPIYRILVLIVVVSFNIIRMRLAKNKKTQK